jgi:hypothetical protein
MDENREDAMLLGVLEASIDVVRLSHDSQESEDRNKILLWWTVFFLGMGTLVGWNR